MDPNATLLELRRIVARFAIGRATKADGPRLADLVEALDGWLHNGGFLPGAWER